MVKLIFDNTLFKLCRYRNIKIEMKERNHYILIHKKSKICEYLIDFKNNRVKETKYIFTTKDIKEYPLKELYKYLEEELNKERILRRLKANSKPIKRYKTNRGKLVEKGREELRQYAMRQNRRFGIKCNF